MLNSKDVGWRVNHDRGLITFTQDSISQPDPLGFRQRVGELVGNYPALGSVFTFTTPRYADTKPYAVCTIPTVPKLNAFSSELFRGLPLAGIEVVQTNDVGETPVAKYVNHLMSNQLVASHDPDLFMHDIFFHWLGAVTTEEKEFDVFKTLANESDQIGRLHGKDVQGSYIARLGFAFDLFSGFGTPSKGESLPDQCGIILGMDYTHLAGEDVMAVPLPEKVLATSRQITADFQTPDNDQKRREYYDEITRRLSQA